MLPIEFGNFGRAAPDAARALGETAVERVVGKHLEAVVHLLGFGPENDIRSTVVELCIAHTVRAVRPLDRAGGIVENPRSDVAAVRPGIVGAGRAIVDRHPATDHFDISLGTG